MTSLRLRVLFVLLLLPIAAFPLEAATRFDIPAQSLAEALRLFASQAKMQLVYKPESVSRMTSNPVVGELDSRVALEQLLKDKGFEVVFLANNAAAIRPMHNVAEVENTAQASRGDQGIQLAQTDQANSMQKVADGDQQKDRGEVEDQLKKVDEPAATTKQLDANEVVVTAQKREERLQDVPISITVLSGEQLDSSTVAGVTDALRNVPGVVPDIAIQGGGTTISIRGVAPSGQTLFGSSPTAYYLDSLPFGLVKSAILPDVSGFDLDRVEVLRGPQGTLYGANALNGVVRILTKDPSFNKVELKARSSVSTTGHGDESSRIDAAVNLPLVDDALAVRAVIGYQDLGGWIDQTAQPLLGIEGHPDVNDSQILTGRLKMKAQFTDQLSLVLSAMASRTDQGGLALSADNRTNIRDDEPVTTDFDAFGATIDYDFRNFSLTSTTSFLQYNNHGFLNFIGFANLETFFDASVLAEEISLVSTHEGPWRWSLGVMYRDAQDNLLQNFGFLTAAAPINYDQGSESIAVFGGLARDLSDQLELEVGLRYFEDSVTQHEIADFELNFIPGGNGLYSNEITFDRVTPRVTLTWHPSDALTTYATYSEGFRSGADQNPNVRAIAPLLPSVIPDTLSNYEVGAKGNLWGGRLSYETALFYVDWQGIQTSFSIPYGGSAISAPANGDSASGLGFEFAVTAEAMDGLTFGTTFGWNDVTYDSDVITLGVVRFFEGDHIAGSPEYTASAFGDYAFALGTGGYEGRVSASAYYTDPKIVSTLSGPVESDGILNGRIAFSVASPNRWTATLFVDNVTDENGVYEPGLISTDDNSHPRPRTTGIQLEYHY